MSPLSILGLPTRNASAAIANFEGFDVAALRIKRSFTVKQQIPRWGDLFWDSNANTINPLEFRHPKRHIIDTLVSLKGESCKRLV